MQHLAEYLTYHPFMRGVLVGLTGGFFLHALCDAVLSLPRIWSQWHHRRAWHKVRKRMARDEDF